MKSVTDDGTEVASLSMLPNASPNPRPSRVNIPREVSPLHERLANHHRMLSFQKLQQKLQMTAERRPSPKSCYTAVAITKSPRTDDVSGLTKLSFRIPTYPESSFSSSLFFAKACFKTPKEWTPERNLFLQEYFSSRTCTKPTIVDRKKWVEHRN